MVEQPAAPGKGRVWPELALAGVPAGGGAGVCVGVVPWQAWLVVCLGALLVYLTRERFRHLERKIALQNTDRSPVAEVVAAFSDRQCRTRPSMGLGLHRRGGPVVVSTCGPVEVRERSGQRRDGKPVWRRDQHR